MEKRSGILFILGFFIIQYVLLFSILFALKEIVFASALSTFTTSVFLVVYLVTSFFVFVNFVRSKRSTNEDLVHQIKVFKKDSENTAVMLTEIRKLIELEDHEGAAKIINELSAESQRIERSKESSLLNVVLSDYRNKCEAHDLRFISVVEYDEISEYLTHKQMTSILGNLLDNAIEAANKLQLEEHRWICLEMQILDIDKKETCLEIVVKNGGQTLCENQKSKIFNAGVTSKQGENHGYGLAVVKDIVRQLGGTIKAVTHPETAIHIIVPQ